MSRIIEFIVESEPEPQPRLRHARIGNFVRTYTPKTADGFKRACVLFATRHMLDEPWLGPVRITIDAYMPRPQRLLKRSSPAGRLPYCGSGGDWDNIAKAVCDALTPPKAKKGMPPLPPGPTFWRDDKQICGGACNLWYVEKDGQPRAEIRIELIEDET